MGVFSKKRSEILFSQSDENSDVFIIDTPFNYKTNNNEIIYIPRFYKTDGYSKPLVTKSLVDGSFGDDVRPAFIHDFLCEHHGYFVNGVFYPLSFKRVNRIFYEAMRDCSISRFKARLMYYAVFLNKDRW